jgi:hypothetical protein
MSSPRGTCSSLSLFHFCVLMRKGEKIVIFISFLSFLVCNGRELIYVWDVKLFMEI